MSEKTLLAELNRISKERDQWQDHIDEVGSRLIDNSVKVKAKALWLLGEMGMRFPERIQPYVRKIAAFTESDEALLRERSLNALGRIGRADYNLIGPYFEKMIRLAEDGSSDVRLAFIWASENIATGTPDVFKDLMGVFADLLDDESIRVRIEAPEMFRVIGKHRPEYVTPYISKLAHMAENDVERVVRIHSSGAIKTIEKSMKTIVKEVRI